MNGKKLIIKEILQKRGITNVCLAKHLGVSTPTISYILNGKSLPSLKTLAEIANFLGVTMGELFDDYNKDNSPQNHTCPHCGKELNITLS